MHRSNSEQCGNPETYKFRFTLDLMLPYAEHTPTGPAETGVGAPVARPVRIDLLLPERCDFVAPDGEPPAVPEVAVDEDHYAAVPDDKIGRARQIPCVGVRAKAGLLKKAEHE